MESKKLAALDMRPFYFIDEFIGVKYIKDIRNIPPDSYIICADGKVPIVSCIMVARCKFFAAAFAGGFREATEKFIRAPETPAAIMQIIVNYLQWLEIPVSNDVPTIMQIYRFADMYGIYKLMIWCISELLCHAIDKMLCVSVYESCLDESLDIVRMVARDTILEHIDRRVFQCNECQNIWNWLKIYCPDCQKSHIIYPPKQVHFTNINGVSRWTLTCPLDHVLPIKHCEIWIVESNVNVHKCGGLIKVFEYEGFTALLNSTTIAEINAISTHKNIYILCSTEDDILGRIDSPYIDCEQIVTRREKNFEALDENSIFRYLPVVKRMHGNKYINTVIYPCGVKSIKITGFYFYDETESIHNIRE